MSLLFSLFNVHFANLVTTGHKTVRKFRGGVGVLISIQKVGIKLHFLTLTQSKHSYEHNACLAFKNHKNKQNIHAKLQCLKNQNMTARTKYVESAFLGKSK